MFRFLLLAFIVVPIVELYLIFQVGSVIGGWETFGLLILDSIIGAWLVRREGFSILAKVQDSLTKGEAPTNSIIDGLLVLVAGALMLTPGFLTDGVGLVLRGGDRQRGNQNDPNCPHQANVPSRRWRTIITVVS